MRVVPVPSTDIVAVTLAAALLALGGFLSSLSTEAFAAPFTRHFDELRTVLDARTSALPETDLTRAQRRERAALKRSLELLGERPAGLAGDLRLAKRLSLVLAHAYADDAELSSYLDVALDDLAADNAAHRLEVRTTVKGLEPDRVRDKAAALLARADAASATAASAVKRTTRAGALRRSERLAAAAGRKASKGTPLEVAVITETRFTVLVAGETHDVPPEALTVTYTPAHDALPASLIVRAPTFGNPLANLVTLTVTGAIKAGNTYALEGAGATVSRTRQLFRATSGELRITYFDLVQGTAAATFAFEAAGADGSTLSLTGGSFSTIDLVVGQ